MEKTEIVNYVFSKFQDILKTNIDELEAPQTKIVLPYFSANDVKIICDLVKSVVRLDQPIYNMKSPCVVVGDLHGNFFDLVRIYQQFGKPEQHSYIFLGDYVDRGEFQFETIFFLFTLKLLYPNKVAIIRGNHEFAAHCSQEGFYRELHSIGYPQEVFSYFISVFNELPPACILDGNTFCVHGGIGPHVSFHTIRQLTFPIKTFDNVVMNELTWSDPTTDATGYRVSPRGHGFLYGEEKVNEFLAENRLKRIFRAHSQLESGVKQFFGGKLYSLFSASNSMNHIANKSGALKVDRDQIEEFAFEPLPVIQRIECISEKNQRQIPSQKSFENLKKFTELKKLPKCVTLSHTSIIKDFKSAAIRNPPSTEPHKPSFIPKQIRPCSTWSKPFMQFPILKSGA